MPWTLLSVRSQFFEQLSAGHKLGIGGIPFLGDWEILAGGTATAKIEESERILGALATAVPDRLDAFFYRVLALRLLERPEEARHALRALESEFPEAARFLSHDIDTGDSSASAPSRALIEGPWGLWAHARLALVERRWHQAVRAYNTLLASAAHYGLPLGAELEMLLGRGYTWLQLGETWRAREDFVTARHEWPSFLEPGLLLDRLYREEGDPVAAEQTFRRLHADAEARDEAAFWVSVAYQSGREYEHALMWAEKVEEESVKARLRASIFFRQAKLREAADAARQALARNPSDAFAHMTFAFTLWFLTSGRRGPSARADLDEAVEHARLAVDLKPESSQTDTLYGILTKDEDFVLRANRLDRDGFLWRARLAWLRWVQKRLPEAEDECRAALEHGENDAWLHLLLGQVLRAQGKASSAQESFLRAIAIDPTLWNAHYYVGLTLLAEARYAEAIPYFHETLNLAPPVPQYLEGLAKALWKVGDMDGDLSAARSAIALQPDRHAAHRTLHAILKDHWLARLERGEELGPVDGLEAPVECLELLAEEPATPPSFLVSAALLRAFAVKKSDLSEALRYANRAIESSKPDGGRGGAFLARALVHIAAEQFSAALSDLEKSGGSAADGFCEALHEHLRAKLQGG